MLSAYESVELKVFTLSIETPDGQLPPARVQVPNIPMRLTSLIPPMQQLCNGIVELAIRREVQRGAKVSCQKGCGVCCCQLVPLSPPEAFFLADYMRRLPSERREALERRFGVIKEAMSNRGLMEKLEKIEDTGEHKELGREYFHMGRPCPFLEDNTCTIHPIRPFSCREYNVTSPPELCRDPINNEVKTVRITRSMMVAMARLSAELYQVPLVTVPLSLSLDWAEKHEAFSQKTWPGVWLFNKMMEFATGAVLANQPGRPHSSPNNL
jgi:Fe-S-cluster containining protein